MESRTVEKREPPRKKRVLLWLTVLLCAAGLLALPFAAGTLREKALYTQGVDLSGAFDLSEEGKKYPFAVSLYERALEGDLEGDSIWLTAEESIAEEAVLLPYLDAYLEQNGVAQAQDWMQVWPVTTETRIVTAKYSPALRLYASAVVNKDGTNVGCTAVSIAYSELELYDISLQPREPLPADLTQGLSMSVESIAGTLEAVEPAAWRLVRMANKAVLWEECAWTMLSDEQGRGWLYRVDYANGSHTPACTLADCSHDTAACAACFDVLRPYIADLGDTLLVFWYDGYTPEGYVKTYACMVEPFSGKRSERVIIGKGDLFNAFATNGRELLFTTYDGQLRWMDLKGGWEKTLLKKPEVIREAFGDTVDPEYSYWFIADANEDALTFYLTRTMQEDSVAADGREEGNIYELCLLRYEIAQEKLWTMHRAACSQRLGTWAVADDALWMVHASTGVIMRTDLPGCETQRWPVKGLETASYVGLDGVIDGKPVFNASYPEENGERRQRYVFDPEMQELRELTLSVLKKGAMSPMGIMDEGDALLCVEHEIVAVTVTETVYGKPNSFVSDEIHYGFIPKEDFFADLFTVTPFVQPS